MPVAPESSVETGQPVVLALLQIEWFVIAGKRQNLQHHEHDLHNLGGRDYNFYHQFYGCDKTRPCLLFEPQT